MEMRARLVVVLTSLGMMHETGRTSFVGRNVGTGRLVLLRIWGRKTELKDQKLVFILFQVSSR
jgi:hypothetical protein